MICFCMLDVLVVEREFLCLVLRASLVRVWIMILSVGLNEMGIGGVFLSLMNCLSRMALRVVGSVNVGMRLNWTFVF